MKTRDKGWQEFWASFFRITHRHGIPGIKDWDKKLVSHLIEILELHEGDKILDLACGGGDQAAEFAKKGITVVGIELTHSLVDHGNRIASEQNLPFQIIQGDMREVNFVNEFQACVILSGSYGFFDDDDNLNVLRIIKNALKPGGQIYIQQPNPLNRLSKKWKGWEEVDGGFVLEESVYILQTGKIHDSFIFITRDGEIIKFSRKPEDQGFSVDTRIYTLPEMIRMIQIAGLEFIQAFGSIELPPDIYHAGSKAMNITAKNPG